MIITPRIFIPDEAISFECIRSSGPGGQNVNKVATAVRLRLRLDSISGLDAEGVERLKNLAGHRLTADEELVIRAESHRTQEGNKREALNRLIHLVSQAAVRPKHRRPTRPTKASKERRLNSKAKTSATKAMRRTPVD